MKYIVFLYLILTYGCASETPYGGCKDKEICELSTFSPDEIYILGTLRDGLPAGEAIAHWNSPNNPLVGFDTYTDERKAIIRPTDGRLIYIITGEDLVREFLCDDCPAWIPTDPYPEEVLANDTILPTPPCDPDGSRVIAFLVAPDNGEIIHSCNNRKWYNRHGTQVLQDSVDIIHLGFNRTALTREFIINFANGQKTPTENFPIGYIRTARALPDGDFWLVIDNLISGDNDNELWIIESNGIASLVGNYPPPPADYRIRDINSRLDPNGNLFQFASSPGSGIDAIVRRNLDGTSEVIYTEADDPVVMIHISELVTGP